MTAIKGRWLSIIESLSFYVKAPRKKSLYTIPAEAWDDNLLLLVQDDIGFRKELLALDLSSWSRLNTSASLLPVKVLLSALTTLPLWPSLLFSHSYWHILFCIVSVCCSPISYLSISFICVVSFCVRQWITLLFTTIAQTSCTSIFWAVIALEHTPLPPTSDAIITSISARKAMSKPWTTDNNICDCTTKTNSKAITKLLNSAYRLCD